jgi:hypothetical protein
MTLWNASMVENFKEKKGTALVLAHKDLKENFV